MPEKDVCVYCVLQVQNVLQSTRCSVEHQHTALGDSCFPWDPSEAGWRGAPPPCDGGPAAAGTVTLVQLVVCACLPSSPEPLKCWQPC